MAESRTKNTKRNIASGFVYRVLSMILPFIVRTAVLYIMGASYTGLTSLFTSILQVLNLAELGFSSAIVYNMYKPIADGDTDTVSALLNYYRKIYFVIGTFILIVGCGLMPWLPKLINGDYPQDINIYLLYFLYLLNTVFSYWLFAYKSSLITAVQRVDLQNKVYSVTLILYNIAHLAVIVFTQNVYLYAIVSICTTVVNNLSVEYLSRKYFPQFLCKGKPAAVTRKKIKKQVAGIMVEKLGDASRNSFDSIIISSVLGLISVTIYSNYYYIFSSIYALLLTITNAMTASVGNSVSKESVKKNYDDLRRFQFIFCGIICACCTCLLCLYQPFMKIWTGEDLMLPFFEMSLFCVYFFILNCNNMGQIYFSTNGLWWKAKIYTLIEAFENLLLNIVLGKLFGIAGVLMATILTIFFLQFIPRTNVTFSEYFKMKPMKYYISTILYGVASVVSCIVAYQICVRIPLEGIPCIAVRLVVCVVVAPLTYMALFAKTEVEKDSIKYLKAAIKRK